MIGFALSQLKSNRKSGLHSKLPTKHGRRWTITFLGQKTDSSPEDDVEDEGSVSEKSESEENVKEEEDHLDSNESSLSDDTEGTSTWLHSWLCYIYIFCPNIFVIFKTIDYPKGPHLEPTFSFELRNQFVDDRYIALLLLLHKLIYDPLTHDCFSIVIQQLRR